MVSFSQVHKFGGTSLADARGFSRCAEIVKTESLSSIVIVSAMAKVTDSLIDVCELAQAGDESYLEALLQVQVLHFEHADKLLPQSLNEEFKEYFSRRLSDLKDILKGVFVSNQCSESVRELISGFGEIWSANLMSLLLQAQGTNADWLNAREVLTVEHGETGPAVLWAQSQSDFDTYLKNNVNCKYLVVTGYIAKLQNGQPTTLKRNGSDYSAAIFAKLSRAKKLTIWTDVDGVMSADPRKVPQAFVVEHLSFDEAMELAFFGAKVIHPKTMAPLVDQKIPLLIRNSFNSKSAGTWIGPRFANDTSEDSPVKGFASIDDIALINLEGTGMLGVPGVAERLFRSMKEAAISVIMISQASSEHSICIAVQESDADRAREEIERTFFFELRHGQIEAVEVSKNNSVLAAVGDRMASTPGVSARFFSALAQARINVRAIAQGSSERNISVVINRDATVRALRAVHSGFYLSTQTLSLAIIGPGLIGKTLMKQIEKQENELHQRGIRLQVQAICNSRKMIFDPCSLTMENFEESLAGAENVDFKKMASLLKSNGVPHLVMVDCTASEKVAECYSGWLKSGFHIVTPNKKANSGSLANYKRLKEQAGASNSHYLYETTVGAGLPIVNTLQELIRTGDRVLSIEGVLSGTLSFIFNELSIGGNFSEIVKKAKALGYTEPDPREDLSGMDVARKVVILAREAGIDNELSDLEIENLLPQEFSEMNDIGDVMSALSKLDQDFSSRLEEAQGSGQKILYVGEITQDGECRAGLKSYPQGHPFTRINGTDNIVLFRTERYNDLPLVVQGPGAGPHVTAAGVFSDLLRLSSFLGGR